MRDGVTVEQRDGCTVLHAGALWRAEREAAEAFGRAEIERRLREIAFRDGDPRDGSDGDE